MLSNEDVKRAAAGIQRLFILRDTDAPMPSFDEMARAALEAVRPTDASFEFKPLGPASAGYCQE